MRRPLPVPSLLLVLAAGLAACGAPPVDAGAGADPAEAAPDPPPPPPELRAGPMVGELGPTRAHLWAQLSGSAPVTVQLAPAPADGGEPAAEAWREARGPGGSAARLHPRAGGRGVVALAGLQPRTSYRYRLVAEGGLPLAAAHLQEFRTPAPVGEAEDFRLAFGSCAGSWGVDPSQPVWRTLAKLRPDLFLWLGDNVYYEREGAEWEDVKRMQARWDAQRGLPHLQGFLASTSQLAIWDDHDYGPDNSDADYPLRAQSLEIFRGMWAPRAWGHGVGVYQHFRRGRAAFFLLDTRAFRTPLQAAAAEERELLGPAQWARLENDLAACRDGDTDWLVVASGNQVLADYHRFESWGRYPAERRRLLGLLADFDGGVLLLSGDRHLGELLWEVDGDSGRGFVEVTSSPLAAGIGDHTPDAQAGERVPGTQVRGEHFAWLEFRQGEAGPVVHYTPRGVAGGALGRTWVLRPQGPPQALEQGGPADGPRDPLREQLRR